jgi:hypothetical protein
MEKGVSAARSVFLMKKEMMTRKTMMRTINEGGGRVPPVHGYGRVKLGHVRLGCLDGQPFGVVK